MVLYDPDTDDSSSDGGAAMAIAGNRKYHYDDDDGMSLNSDLFEEYEDKKMMPSGMDTTEAKKYGKGLVLSDADSVGDDNAFTAPTMKTRLAVAAHDDEHSIGSDDEFVPQTRKNTRKTITKNDRQFDSLIPTSSKAGDDGLGGGEVPAQAHAPAHAAASGSRAASDAAVAEGLAIAARIRGGGGAGVAPSVAKSKLTKPASASAREPASPISVSASQSTQSPSTPASPAVAADVGSDTLSEVAYGSGTTLKDNRGTSYSKRAVSEDPELRARLRGFLAKYKDTDVALTKAIKSRLGKR